MRQRHAAGRHRTFAVSLQTIEHRYEELPTVVGLWTLQGDRDKARQRIACSQSVHLCVRFGEAIDQIEQMAHPLIVAAAQNDKAAPPAPVAGS